MAATELALLAGADRVEGTLFGNGERTGNVDILTVAYNMFSQGINPELNIENVREIAEVYERCTKMDIPYDILMQESWYLPHFPALIRMPSTRECRLSERETASIGRFPTFPLILPISGGEYEPIVRINSQSGKGGVAFVMDTFWLQAAKGHA